jgi:hypothetical protein
LYKEAAFEVIKQRPVAYLAFQFKRSLSSFFTNRYEYLIRTLVAAEVPSLYKRFSSIFNMLLVLGEAFWLAVYMFACVALFRKSLLPVGLFMLSLIAVTAGLSGGINPGGSEMSRYMLPFSAFLFLFAAAGVEVFSAWIQRIIGRAGVSTTR